MPADVIVMKLVFVLITRISFGSRNLKLFPATKFLKWTDFFFEVVAKLFSRKIFSDTLENGFSKYFLDRGNWKLSQQQQRN